MYKTYLTLPVALAVLAPVTVLAQSDGEEIAEVDAKATYANQKADGNRSRIQALETEDQFLHERIDAIEQKLAGSTCPSGLAVVGFDEQGSIVCAAPWLLPPDGEPPSELTFTCTINVDQIGVEQQIVATIRSAQQSLATSGLPSFSFSGSVDVDVNFGAIVFDSNESAAVQFVELIAAQPCDDAIEVSANTSGATIAGTYEVDLGFGIVLAGTFSVDVSNFMVASLVELSELDLGTISVGSYDRDVASVSTVGVDGGNVSVQVDGPIGTYGNLLANLVESYFSDALATAVASEIANSIGNGSLFIAPPVTVEVLN